MQSKSIKKSIVKISDCFWSVYAYNIIIKTGKDVIDLRETRILEFKETITNTFFKNSQCFFELCWWNNLFWGDNGGTVKGLPDVKQDCLDIRNRNYKNKTTICRESDKTGF